jgi:hypothetical protein
MIGSWVSAVAHLLYVGIVQRDPVGAHGCIMTRIHLNVGLLDMRV